MIEFIYTLWVVSGVCLANSILCGILFFARKKYSVLDTVFDILGSITVIIGVPALIIASVLSAIDLFFEFWGTPPILCYVGVVVSVLAYFLASMAISVFFGKK